MQRKVFACLIISFSLSFLSAVSEAAFSCASPPTTIQTPGCSGSNTITCPAGSTRISIRDIGQGNNHGVSEVGNNGCRAWEATGNYGTCGCEMECTSSGGNSLGGYYDWYEAPLVTKLTTPTCSGSAIIECPAGTTRTAIRDTGSGRNHRVENYGANGCLASEHNNPSNNGTCGCEITCTPTSTSNVRYTCNTRTSTCTHPIGSSLCTPINGPKACSSSICQGTASADVSNCFLSEGGMYKNFDTEEVCAFCPDGLAPIKDDTQLEGFRCGNPIQIVAPKFVAPDQIVQLSCLGNSEILPIPGFSESVAPSQFRISLVKNNQILAQMDWSDFETISTYRVGNYWAYLDSYAAGNYQVRCEVRFDTSTVTYASELDFTIDPQNGTSCTLLEFEPDRINANETTQATCNIQNAMDGKRTIVSQKKQDTSSCLSKLFQFGRANLQPIELLDSSCMKGWGSKAYTNNVIADYINDENLTLDTTNISSSCSTATTGLPDGILARTTCSYTGGLQTITIPNGVRQIHVKAWGAGGAADGDSGSYGGAGGFTDGLVEVTSAEIYSIVVGQGGAGGSSTTYGFGAGGNTLSSGPSNQSSCTRVPMPQGNGGGLSGFFSGSGSVSATSHNRAIVVAGGGGGSGRGGVSSYAPKNGNQKTGNVTANMQGQSNVTSGGGASIEPCNGGGGGGYRGGKNNLAGSYYHGYGGSGYSRPGGRVLNSSTAGIPPMVGDSAYRSGIARGGSGAGGDGGNGLVVIEWLAESNFNVTNHLQGYSENGEYMNTCIAHAEANYVGLSDEEKEMVPYIGVTSAACGGNNLANTDGMSVHVGSGNGGIPVYVGNSYCSAIEVPTLVYEDRAFDVTCRLDASRGAPTGYQIKVNGAIIKTGSITSGQTEVVETMALRSGTNTVECLIQGPDNVSYVTPSCSTVVTPEIEPAGSCQTGDSVLNATLCSGDDVGVGADIPTIVVNTCSDSRKCEYICNDGYVAFSGGCIERADYGQVSVPSHIRPFEDYPLVMCQGDVGDGFWKYQIKKKLSVTAIDTSCPLGSVGSHPNCICAIHQTYDAPSRICRDIPCPEQATGDYPACQCPDGSYYQGTDNTCQANEVPNCSCPTGYTYDVPSQKCLSLSGATSPRISTQIVRQNCTSSRTSSCTATCPAGTTMVGGGVDWVATDGACHAVDSYPNGNGWTGGIAGSTNETTSCTAAVEAVCASENDTHYFSDPNSHSGKSYTCPGDMKVTHIKTYLSPSGDDVCNTNISSDGKTASYGGCNAVSGQQWRTDIICASVENYSFREVKTPGDNWATFTCPGNTQVLSARTLRSPSGATVCNTAISTNGRSVTYGGCHSTAGQEYNSDIVCGTVAEHSYRRLTTPGGTWASFTCPGNTKVLYAETILGPSGTHVCGTSITNGGRSVGYGGCVPVSGQHYSTDIVCGKKEPEITTQTVRKNCTAGRTSTCTATCPARTTMISGGVDWIATNGSCHMVESKPQGNGWHGGTAASTSSTTSCTASVEVVCASKEEVTVNNCSEATPEGTSHVSRPIPNGSNGGTLYCSDTVTIPDGCTGNIVTTGFADGLAVGESGTGGGGAALYVYRKDNHGGAFQQLKLLNSHYNTGGPRLTLNETYTTPGVYRVCTAANKAHSGNLANASGTITIGKTEELICNGPICNIEYITASSTATTQTNDQLTATCPTNKKVISGGCFSGSHIKATTQSYPTTDGKSWKCNFNQDVPRIPDTNGGTAAYAVCAIVDSSYEVIRDTGTVPNTINATKTVACPVGKNLTGGGCATGSGSYDILHAFPLTDGRSFRCNLNQDDGAALTGNGFYNAYAICIDPLSGYEIQENSGTTTTQTNNIIEVSCPSGKTAIGGGCFNGSGNFELHHNFTSSDLQKFHCSYNEDNPTIPNAGMGIRASSICIDAPTSQNASSSDPSDLATQIVRKNCPAGRSSQCSAICPTGTTMTGGGVDWVGTNGSCHVVESKPNGNGWTGGTAATTNTTTSCTAAVEAVCLLGKNTSIQEEDASCSCNAGLGYDPVSHTCKSCPGLATGTYPSCTCASGYNYNAANNICVAIPKPCGDATNVKSVDGNGTITCRNDTIDPVRATSMQLIGQCGSGGCDCMSGTYDWRCENVVYHTSTCDGTWWNGICKIRFNYNGLTINTLTQCGTEGLIVSTASTYCTW